MVDKTGVIFVLLLTGLFWIPIGYEIHKDKSQIGTIVIVVAILTILLWIGM